ncbi:MAG TPA: 2-phosphosulfolactate phosphatase, partial [Rubrobacter sp.]|nr:2-phosphosulfolactate phosphatase [Rubrobacter sp.]
AAGSILHRLSARGAELDERALRVVEGYLSRPASALKANSAARRLKRLGYERDLEFCLAEDTVPVVPCLADGAFVGGGSGTVGAGESSARRPTQKGRFCS